MDTQWKIVVVDLGGDPADIDCVRTAIPDSTDMIISIDVAQAVAALASTEFVPNPQTESAGRLIAIVLADSVDAARVQHAVTQLKAVAEQVPIVVVTDDRPSGDVLRFFEAGCDDFSPRPIRPQLLRARLEHLCQRHYGQDPVTAPLMAKFGLKQIVGESAPLLAVIAKLPAFSRCDATVLLDGETGTGKEVIARAIHYLSPRANKPFVPVNCGAIPLDLIENELFGHDRAAYTGATVAGKGVVAEAEGGTLFLDEIDALPPKAQVKLLRLLQDKEYRPLGSPRMKRADVRILAATNRDLAQERQHGRVREDFFYRICVLRLTMPPLRERGHDVVLLADHFVDRFTRQLRRPRPALSPGANRSLLLYDWPGNVRELEHVMERAVILAEERPVIGVAELQLPVLATEGQAASLSQVKQNVVARFETGFIRAMLQAHHGNVTHAAVAACKNPRAFRQLIRKYNIDVNAFRSPRA